MKNRIVLCTGLAVLAIFTMGPLPASVAAAPAPSEPGTWRVGSREVFAPDGSVRRMPVRVRVPSGPTGNSATGAPATATARAKVVPIQYSGPRSSRFDLVFVGDGYTSSQMGLYSEHVKNKVAEIFAIEPFRSYRGQFNIWQVNVISAQSGVDNDPDLGVLRNTALDMSFWCQSLERLLCVDENKAYQYAAAAGDVDQIIALANSTKYGGAGDDPDFTPIGATASGAHVDSGAIAVHELGHSIGKLADEYGGYAECYPYDEPTEPNASRYNLAQMAYYEVKWHRFLGQPSPDGGVVGAYTGGRYYDQCIYRPTENSIMRSLKEYSGGPTRQFNLPGREAMIAGFYRETGVVQAAAPPDAKRPWVIPVGKAKTTWHVDGRKLSGPLIVALLPRGTHTVTATVTDPTSWVQDEELRAKYMTATYTWTVRS